MVIAALALLLADAIPAADAAFLARNARAAGVRTIPGIQYQVLESGPATGATPARTSAVKIRYTGRFVDGTTFDTSEGKGDGTAIFPVRGVIPGFQAAVTMMRPGDRWRVTIPPALAYGMAGHKLSGRVLVFEITLIDHAELPPAAPPTMTELPKR